MKPLDQLKIASILGSDRVVPMGKKTITVTMEMDELDFKALLDEIKDRKRRAKALGLKKILLPDGDSDETGAIVAVSGENGKKPKAERATARVAKKATS